MNTAELDQIPCNCDETYGFSKDSDGGSRAHCRKCGLSWRMTDDGPAPAADRFSGLRTLSVPELPRDYSAEEIAAFKKDNPQNFPPEGEAPVRLHLDCPNCGRPHVDLLDPTTGIDWETKPHKTHLCLACHELFKPYDYPTVGVAEPAAETNGPCCSVLPPGAELADFDLQAGGRGMSTEECEALWRSTLKGGALASEGPALKQTPEEAQALCAAAVAQVINPKDAAAADRVPFHIYPPAGHILGTMACLDGAVKYGPYNWRERDISLTSYVGAIIRHCHKILGGEDEDPESTYKLHHLAHINATSAILLDAKEAGALIDDRPKRQVDCAKLISQCNALIKAHNAARTENK